MNVLVACEFSGRVRDAFRVQGHYAFSCDLLDTERPGFHYRGDVSDLLKEGWDMMLAFPPCTYLAVSGARHFTKRKVDQSKALAFVRKLMDAPIPKICIENPVSVISTFIRKPEQIIQPWMFGEPYTKSTCLWLKGLPKLRPTNIVEPAKKSPIHYMPPSPDRWKNRSRTAIGIAEAMAQQWA